MDLNHVTLTGILERDPLTRFADHGTQHVSFTLRLTAVGPAGQVFTLYVPCKAYGQAAELAGDLHAGAAVLVAGKLKWTSYTDKHGEKRTDVVILGRLVTRLAPASGVMESLHDRMAG
jgi:single-stranded DNA-binding protein